MPDKISNTTSDEIRQEWDWHRIIWDVASRVREYVPGSIGWIAKQKTDEPGDWYGFVIGNGFACVEIEQARNADDVLIRQLATHILGYEPDSKQDLQRRIKEADDAIVGIQDQIASLERQLRYWQDSRQSAQGKLGNEIVEIGKKNDD